MEKLIDYQKYLNVFVDSIKSIGPNVQIRQMQADSIGGLYNNMLEINSTHRKPREALFTLAHLFGHWVQFQTYSEYKHLVSEVEKDKPLNLSNSFKKAFFLYEREAFEYGKYAMYESFDNLISMEHDYDAFFQVDFDCYWNYLITGHQISQRNFYERLIQSYASTANEKTILKCKKYTITTKFTNKAIAIK